MAKLWGFGDSFTQGIGLFNDPYNSPFPYGDIYKDCRFLTQLGFELDLEVENRGSVGSSNQTILENIVCNLYHIKKGDVVIIGGSVPSRFPIYVNEYARIDVQPGFIERTKDFILGKIHPSDNDKVFKVFSKEELKVIGDYYLTLFPKQDEVYAKNYERLFTSIQRYFISNGISCTVWDYSCWGLFENIVHWTKGSEFGLVYDDHWSPNAHMLFKEVLVKALSENTLFINSELLSFNKWIEKAKEKHNYIPAKLKYEK